MRCRISFCLLFAFAVIFSLCPASGAEYPQAITTSSPFVNLPRPDDDDRWVEAFSHWDRRDDTEEVMAAVRIFEAIAKDTPGRFESQLWLLRSYHLAGMRNRREEARMDYMRKALAAGDRALAIEPGNGFAVYWRFCTIGLMRDLSQEELEQAKTLGAKYRHVRELPVPDNDELWAEAMRHWDSRLDRENALKAIEIFEKLEKKYPDRIEPRMWLARSNYWMHYLAADREGMAKWGMAAAEWGRKALELEPRNPGASFWTASGLGQYADNTSFVNVVRYSLEMGKRLLVVVEEDPNYFYGGFSNYFASAIARAGELVARTAEIIGFPRETIERLTVFASSYEPNYLRNHYALAEMYIRLGRLDEAKKMLEVVINSDPTVLKLQEPENRTMQKWSRRLMEEHFGNSGE